MAWTKRAYSKGRIDAAGVALLHLAEDDPAREAELQVVNNWRSCHGYPLQILKMTLLHRSRDVYKDALIAQRIKRLSSITIKLRDNGNMRLSQMQDIGGCRAVLHSVGNVYKVVAAYEKSDAKNPTDRAVLVAKADYISEPKCDGYRSVHLIYRYQTRFKMGQDFNGQKIEIQIRSQLQHAWATAVETAQTFSGQAMKTKVKTASAAWLRFFALMGTEIAMRERRPVVPGTPDNRAAVTAEIRHIQNEERILEQLEAWNAVVNVPRLAEQTSAHTFVLELDPTRRTLSVTPFEKQNLMEAEQKYLEREKATEHDPRIQVVLVAVDSLAALRRAYPNYYVDSSAFIEAVKAALKPQSAIAF